MKRTFFAVQVSYETSRLLKQISAQFPEFSQAIKLANPENPHITLKFLGETRTGDIDEIDLLLKKAFSETEAFSFLCEGTGCFPNPRRPAVLWLGITEGLKNLQFIHNLLESNLEKFDYARDNRKFKPHLTYGRVKKHIKTIKSLQNFLNLEYKPIVNKVNEIIWFESLLTPQGAVHKPIGKYKLK